MERLRQRIQSRSWLRLARGSKWVAAGALIFDADGRLLLIRNRMRDSWEYPAGSSDGRESPLDTCRREVAEEVGLNPARLRLIGIDFFHRATPNGNLLFTFAAVVDNETAKQVRTQFMEVSDHRWVTRDEALTIIAPRLKGRLRELLGAYDRDQPIYLHTGDPVL